jgi:hypothetical protein
MTVLLASRYNVAIVFGFYSMRILLLQPGKTVVTPYAGLGLVLPSTNL